MKINEKLKWNNDWKEVTDYFHVIALIGGLVFVGLSIVLRILLSETEQVDKRWQIISSFISEIPSYIGGSLLSIALVTIFYKKWQDKKLKSVTIVDEQFDELKKMQNQSISIFTDSIEDLKNEQAKSTSLINNQLSELKSNIDEKRKDSFFLMSPSFYSNGYQLEPIAHIDKNYGKILLIGDVTEGAVKKEYGFITLLDGDNFKLIDKNKPLFSYGTKFQFLNNLKQKKYYEHIKNAIIDGLSLKVSILFPDKKIIDNPNLEEVVKESRCTIQDFKDLLVCFIKEGNKIAPIELRLSRYFSPCSFSSLEFLNGRTIRSLEFNFMHEGNKGKKMTQIYDTKPLKNEEKDIHEAFSHYLFKRYERLYGGSFLALRYPMEDITYHVLGILIDDIPDANTKSKKIAIIDENKKLIKVSVHMVVNEDGYLLQVKGSKDHCILNDDISSIKNRYESLDNTIIGNVIVGYEKITGCKIEPFESFEIKKKDKDYSNDFILLGRIVETTKNSSYYSIDISDDDSEFYQNLRSFVDENYNPDIVPKITRTIKVS